MVSRVTFARFLAIETDRWPLWLPVFMIVGIAGYFSLRDEPPLWLGLSGVVIFGLVTYSVRDRGGLLRAALVLLVLSLSVTSVQWRTFNVAAPVLEKKLNWATLQGQIVRVEKFPKRLRVTLDHLRIQRLDAHKTPYRIRVRLQGKQPDLKPGDWISIRANLSPPPAPAAPGAFDFQRQSYFNGLGAVGFSFGRARILSQAKPVQVSTFQTSLAQWRQKITEKVLALDHGPVGAIAAALMTGDRSAIPEDVMNKVRDSGLAHLLAISGLHIGLVAGILFIGLRSVLVLIPYIALRYPIKKWVAALAIPGALAYALISGASIPTLRAFLMITLVLLAVLVDRRGISMRMVAWAAAIILLFQPESVLGASFQMSFAAVIALIAVYEYVSYRRKNQEFHARTFLRTVGLYVGGVALTTLVAWLATAPFAIYHFNRFALYGLAANLIAVPITALWIMPWAVISFLLMPFGLEHLALTPMLWGVQAVIDAAQTVADWPSAAISLPAMSTEAMAVIALGLVWLCLWRSRWRLFGCAGIAAGLATLLFFRAPDILIDGEGKLMAVRLVNGQYAVTSLRRKKYTREVWLRRIGHSGPTVKWPKKGSSPDRRLSCDGQGCLYRSKHHIVSLAEHPGALIEDCYTATVVISTVPIRRACTNPIRTIDRFDLWREGAHAIWLDETGVRVETVNGWRGNRPWVLRPDKIKRNFGS